MGVLSAMAMSWLLVPGAALDAGVSDPLAPAMALVGRWVADPDPQAPGVTGWSVFEREAQGHALVRKNHAEYPATTQRPASVHDDVMVLYAEQGQLRAEYVDSEGHHIRYGVSAAGPSTLVFLSDAGVPGPRFRLTYAWTAKDRLTLLFEIAPPGTADGFKPYIRATLHRG